jgi:hypothetical protein
MSLKSTSGRISPWILFAAFAALYLLTQTANFDYDTLILALDLEFAQRFPLHPNHLLAPLPAWLLYRCLPALHYTPRALNVLLFTNALLAAGAVAYLFKILQGRIDRWTAQLVAGAWGLSHAFWKEAVDGRAYAMAGLTACFVLDRFLKLSATNVFVTGLAVGAASAVHQLFLLTIPAFLFRLLRGSALPNQQTTVKQCVTFLGGVLVAIVPCYWFATHVLLGQSGWSAWEWIVSPSGNPVGAGPLKYAAWHWNLARQFITTLAALFSSWVAPDAAITLRSEIEQAIVACMLLLWVGLYSIRVKRERLTDSKVVVGGCLLWLAAMSLFQWVWDPGALRLRVLFMPALVLLVCELIGAQNKSTKRTQWLTWAAVGVVALANYTRVIAPNHNPRNNAQLVRLQWLRSQLRPNDFFIYWGTLNPRTISNVYVLYFLPTVKTQSVQGYLFGHQDPSLAGLSERMRQTAATGGKNFIEETLLDKEVQNGLATFAEDRTGRLQDWFNKQKIIGRLTGPDYNLVEVR